MKLSQHEAEQAAYTLEWARRHNRGFTRLCLSLLMRWAIRRAL